MICISLSYACIYDDSFFQGAEIRSGVFDVSVSVWDSRNYNFSVKLLRSSAVFGERRLSPCPMRSAPRREHGWMLSKGSEKCEKKKHFERYSPANIRILMYGEVDKIKLGEALFPNWRQNVLQNNECILLKNNFPSIAARLVS